jgi:hypothetical protein
MKTRSRHDKVGQFMVDLSKFYHKQRPSATSDCIEWTGSVNNCGYGLVGADDTELRYTRMITPHRLALTMKLGRPIAPGMNANHTCHNRLCVNPDHLTEGTQQEKIRIMRDADMFKYQLRTGNRPYHHKQHGRTYKYTEDDIRWIRQATIPEIMARYGRSKANAQGFRSRFRSGYGWCK